MKGYRKFVTGVTKAMALALQKQEKKIGFKGRIQKIERGNYTVWTTRGA